MAPYLNDELYKEAKPVLENLKRYTTILCESLGVSLKKPRDLYLPLKLSKRLGWKLHKYITSDDVFSSVQSIPGSPGFNSFLELVKNKGLNNELIEKTNDSYKAFLKLIEQQTDRNTLEKLLMAYSKDGLRSAYTEQTKTAFHANSFVFGIRAKVMFSALTYTVDLKKGTIQCNIIEGFEGIERTRPDVVWTRRKRTASVNDETRGITITPMDHTITSGIPWLTDYCSKNLPEPIITDESHYYYPSNFPESMGSRAPTRLVTGEMMQFKLGNETNSAGENDETVLDFSTSIKIPVETLYLDLFIPPGYLPEYAPETFLLNDLRDSALLELPSQTRRITDSLPDYSTLKMLGSEQFSATTMELPYYPDLVKKLFSSSSLRREDYQHWRLSIDYPPLPSTAGFSWNLE